MSSCGSNNFFLPSFKLSIFFCTGQGRFFFLHFKYQVHVMSKVLHALSNNARLIILVLMLGVALDRIFVSALGLLMHYCRADLELPPYRRYSSRCHMNCVFCSQGLYAEEAAFICSCSFSMAMNQPAGPFIWETAVDNIQIINLSVCPLIHSLCLCPAQV